MYVCMYLCMILMHVYTYICMYVCMHVFMYVCMYHTYVCTYVRMGVCVCLCYGCVCVSVCNNIVFNVPLFCLLSMLARALSPFLRQSLLPAPHPFPLSSCHTPPSLHSPLARVPSYAHSARLCVCVCVRNLSALVNITIPSHYAEYFSESVPWSK
jgi:hypothetical protein